MLAVRIGDALVSLLIVSIVADTDSSYDLCVGEAVRPTGDSVSVKSVSTVTGAIPVCSNVGVGGARETDVIDDTVAVVRAPADISH